MAEARILVVEDDVIAAEDLRELLTAIGYQVIALVGSGEKAIDTTDELQPDLILMDIKLKGEMDGIEAAERIRAHHDIPVIFLTALSDKATLQRASVSDPFGYLLKPLRIKDLQTAIEVGLNRHKAERALRESERKFRSFVEQSSEGILLTDETGVVIEWNRSAERITGIAKDEILEQPVWSTKFQLWQDKRDATDPREWNKSEVLEALNSGESPWLSRDMERTYLHQDGSERVVQQKLFPIKTDQGFRIGGVILDVTERIGSEQRLQHLATHDPLTGLANRTLFYDRMDRAIANARRKAQRVAVLFMDLDRFKIVNDSYGHEAGDNLLQSIARRFETIMRQSDTIARLGGDEFALCVEDLFNHQDAAVVAEKILAALSAPFDVSGNDVTISASIGISLFPEDGENTKDLLIKADAAMYRAKSSGKNNYQFSSPLN